MQQKVHEFFGKEEEFSRKVVVFPLALVQSFFALVAGWDRVDGGTKKLPAFRRMGECAQVAALRFFVRGYALASGAPKGVAVRPTPSVAAG